MRAVVALVEARPETIVEDYRRVLELAGWAPLVREDPAALVVRAGVGAWQPGTVSPPWQLDGTLSWLGGQRTAPGKAPVVLAVGGAGHSAAAEAWGWPEVMARHGADPASDHFRSRRSFRAEPDLPALRASLPRGLTLPAGLRDRATLLLPVPALEKERPVAGAVRLLTDLLAPDLSVPRGSDGIAARTEVLRFARQALPSLAVVMDAVHWRVGPDSAVARNVLLAGTDPVAVDAVATRLAGRSTARDPFFRACRDEDLGAVRAGDIRLVGRTDLVGREFGVPEKYVGGKLPDWLRKPADRILGPALARSGNHQRNTATPWGRLFADYRARGAVGESR